MSPLGCKRGRVGCNREAVRASGGDCHCVGKFRRHPFTRARVTPGKDFATCFEGQTVFASYGDSDNVGEGSPPSSTVPDAQYGELVVGVPVA